MSTEQPLPEFSRPVIAEQVSTSGITRVIEATPAERAALARRFDLVAIDRLAARLSLKRVRGEFIRVTGTLDAEVVQTCVVTLEPVPATVADAFSALYAPDHLLPQAEDEEVEVSFASAADEEDVPEAMPGGIIDIGELAAQHLSLALDPYPRRPGAEIPPELRAPDPDGEQGAEQRPNPFAALSSLKRAP